MQMIIFYLIYKNYFINKILKLCVNIILQNNFQIWKPISLDLYKHLDMFFRNGNPEFSVLCVFHLFNLLGYCEFNFLIAACALFTSIIHLNNFMTCLFFYFIILLFYFRLTSKKKTVNMSNVENIHIMC